MVASKKEPHEPSKKPTPRSGERGRDLAFAVARVIEETRGTDVVVLDLRKATDVFDYFVLATGTSRRQMHAMADEIKHTIRRDCHDDPRGVEGYEDGRWIVMDYGDVVVHLFDADARQYWDLDHLWGNVPQVSIPPVGVTAG